jgi:hypothetical protein
VSNNHQTNSQETRDPKREQDILSLGTSPVGTLCGWLRAAIDATPRHQFNP